MSAAPPASGAPRTTASGEATEALGARFAPALRIGDVVALTGPLGAGKTRFVSGVARGVDARAQVRSPSFTLVNEYRGRVLLLHLDLYRIEPMDADALGLEEQIERGALLVEWGEKLPARLRRDALRLTFAMGEGDTRRLSAAAESGRGLELLDAWRSLDG
jgi:tRNA threonylcarbamoyladenosine biosynthesis protein TsaE